VSRRSAYGSFPVRAGRDREQRERVEGGRSPSDYRQFQGPKARPEASPRDGPESVPTPQIPVHAPHRYRQRRPSEQKDENRMKRIAMLMSVTTLAAPLLVSPPTEAQTAAQSNAKSKSSAAHKVPMHPDTLTLYPHGRPERHRSPHSYTRHPFNQPTPIHNTFMGPRYYQKKPRVPAWTPDPFIGALDARATTAERREPNACAPLGDDNNRHRGARSWLRRRRAVSPFTRRRQRSSAPPRRRLPRRWASPSASMPARRWCTRLVRSTHSMRRLEAVPLRTVPSVVIASEAKQIHAVGVPRSVDCLLRSLELSPAKGGERYFGLAVE
jgi:hypothetical protein